MTAWKNIEISVEFQETTTVKVLQYATLVINFTAKRSPLTQTFSIKPFFKQDLKPSLLQPRINVFFVAGEFSFRGWTMIIGIRNTPLKGRRLTEYGE